MSANNEYGLPQKLIPPKYTHPMKICRDLSRQESYLAGVTLKNKKFEEFIKEIIKYADIIEKHNF